MKVKILGCEGSIGGIGKHTTSMLIDEDILLDAGTGVVELPLEALAKIDHVFLTHSHLDHIASLPLLVEAVAGLRDKPIYVYALDSTIEILKNHIFNWSIWPDFANIKIKQHPVMQFVPIQVGNVTHLNNRHFAPIPAKHTVPAVGYCLSSEQASLVFSGDTACDAVFWEAINQIKNLRYLIIETTFAKAAQKIAVASRHLSTPMLANELTKLTNSAEIYISHIKASHRQNIEAELLALYSKTPISLLKHQQIFEF